MRESSDHQNDDGQATTKLAPRQIIEFFICWRASGTERPSNWTSLDLLGSEKEAKRLASPPSSREENQSILLVPNCHLLKFEGSNDLVRVHLLYLAHPFPN